MLVRCVASTVEACTAPPSATSRSPPGVSIGSIYHHFGDKEGIAFALYRLGIEDMLGVLLSRLATQESLASIICGCVDDYLDWYGQHIELGQHVFQFSDSRFLEQRESAIATLGRDFLDQFGSLAESHGWGSRRDAEFTVRFVTGGCREFLRLWLASPDKKALEDARAELRRLALASFGMESS